MQRTPWERMGPSMILCQEDLYLEELVRYIHLNPLRAGLVEDMKREIVNLLSS